MAKRYQALIPLTHDHHHALAHAQRLIQAADKQPDALDHAAAEFIAFYETETLVHFREEEEELFPKLLESVEEPPPDSSAY